MDNFVFLAVVGVLLLFVGNVVYQQYQRQRRMAQMRDVAVREGYDYAEEDPGLLDTRGGFALFSRGRRHRATNVLRMQIDDASVQIFDHRYSVSSDQNQNVYRQSVLSLESERLNLPTFALQPETLGQKLATLFGRQDIDFADRPDFSEAYLLQGSDEARIRRLFGEEQLAFFARRPGLCVEGRGQRLVYYRAGQRVAPERIPSFLQEGLALFQVLAAEPAARTAARPAVEPAQPAAEPDALAGLDELLAEMGVDEDRAAGLVP